ncbi:MAG: FAD-binding monooxygenase [Maritimibacter sp.]
MQYHLNGFRPGDPTLFDAASHRRECQGPVPNEVDVLIVGSGPAGLTLAAQLAAFPNITTRIVERKLGPMEKGQADGISCRSMEMFNAFGFAEKVMKQGYQVNEVTFWKPDPQNPRHILRTGRVDDVQEGLSEMPHIILNQARVHDMYLEIMEKSPSRLKVDYGYDLEGLSVDEAADDYPVHVTLAPSPGSDTAQKTLRARFVVGCDGARSAVRGAIGRELMGDSANKAWGVMDVLMVTDFPDVRYKTLIKSANEGNLLIIPREGGYLTRIYIEMDELGENERVADRKIKVEDLINAAQRIFKPYNVEVKDVAWWSVYEIGQRLTDKFDDVPEADSANRTPRVFIAGDACHTHSPKAGQGMNVSMGDSFNLGWKLIHVLEGRTGPELLHSYSAERQAVAQDLIDFDREWSRIMSQAPDEADAKSEAPTFQKAFIENGVYTAGMSVTYAPSLLTGADTHQSLARGFAIGTRFHSAPVTRLGDGKPMELGHCILADARWHMFAFAPDELPTSDDSKIAKLCEFLTQHPSSPLRKFTPIGADQDAVIDLRAVLQQGHKSLAFDHLPEALKPRKGVHEMIDYEKVFCPAHQGPDIFDARGIDRKRGALVIVRPDQYVAHVLPLDDYAGLAGFFGGIMKNPE